MRLLELDPHPVPQSVEIPNGIEAQYRNSAAVGYAKALDAFHRGRLACAVRSDQPEDLTVAHLERHVIHRDDRAVRLANSGDLYDWTTGRRMAHPRMLLLR